jgi:hypothetical protein
MKPYGLILFVLFFFFVHTAPSGGETEIDTSEGSRIFFYQDLEYGSESQFNPVSSFLNYSLDTLQVPKSFDQENFTDHFDETWRNLRDPVSAINREGGFKAFVNRQIFPIDFDNLDESTEMVPNYALHLLGGGMVYRKNAEWLRMHGYPFPRASAAVLSMAAEFLQEVYEKKSTPPDDEVADFYIFRPAGILLFNWDAFALFAAHTLQMVEWPYQPLYNVSKGKFTNAGENFAVRPDLFGSERVRPFLYFGLTTLAGLSHRLNSAARFSWGIGGAVEKAARNDFQARPSGGFFYDRNNSLLASVIVNGTDNLAVRLNIYPGFIVPGKWSPGVFLGVTDSGNIIAGLTLKVAPLGIGFLFD